MLASDTFWQALRHADELLAEARREDPDVAGLDFVVHDDWCVSNVDGAECPCGPKVVQYIPAKVG